MLENAVVLEQIVSDEIKLVIICHIIYGAPSARLAANKLRVGNVALDFWIRVIFAV